MHRVLAGLLSFENDAVAKQQVQLLCSQEKMAPEDCRMILEFLRHPTVSGWFAPGGRVYTEREIAVTGNGENRFLRIDRLIERDTCIAIIDFKSGTDFSPEHEEQVRLYAAALLPLYPHRTIDAFLGYIDTVQIREVIC